MAARIKTGDTVEVVTGDAKIKGQRGKVTKVDTKKGRVTIEGVNFVWKHLRRSQEHPKGGRIEREASIDLSNVMVVDPQSGKPTRIGFTVVEENGKQMKKRVAKKSGTILD